MKKIENITFLLLLSSFLISGSFSFAQQKQDVYVDSSGIMRWGHSNKQVEGFGVNYSVPFAHAYRTGKKQGVDLKKAIDDDIYHFSRLGFDLYRIHIWDTEISDDQGNLLDNEHLELFDYLINELKKREINFMLTPIAYWGNGWPEPDEDTPGFSNKYGKENSLINPEAIKAQENYLAQFLEHVNPYTGLAYKEEPNVIGFEVSNEPHHREQPEKVKEFINRMVAAIRSTGTKKPVFYNVSHSIHLAETYAEANIDGGTFQWYPTGLGFGEELEGNLLPNVNEFKIPFDELWRENDLAKLVYEFDAADVMKSYIYPAMARSFRQAGIQIATHFAYDPTYLAYANTEYNTHYMNLVYTPQKALALMISGEIFHRLPLYAEPGEYPENLTFGDFRISYKQDLTEMNSAETFIYTNNTESSPKSVKKLKKIAGFGTSEVVKYQGKGAYFLDKLENGVWRLEVMPDAILVENPFGKNSLDKTVAVINHKPWEMQIDLPELGSNFNINGLNNGNSTSETAKGIAFTVNPGTYLLSRDGRNQKDNYKGWKAKDLTAFVAPSGTVEKTYLMHEPLFETSEASNIVVSAEVVSNEEVQKVEAWFRNRNTYESTNLEPAEGYKYSARVPEKLLVNGFLDYRIIVTTNSSSYTFPSGAEGNPGEWDFYQDESYSTRIVEKEAPVYLFNASEDSERVVGKWLPTFNTVPTYEVGESEYQVNVEQLFEEDVENRNAEPIYDYSFRYNFQKKLSGRKSNLRGKEKLMLKARALNEKPVKLQIAFVLDNGSAFGTIIELQPEIKEYEIEFLKLQPVNTVNLPRPYPTFLPYYFKHSDEKEFDLQKVESLQFSIGPGLSETEQQEQHGVGIISARLVD